MTPRGGDSFPGSEPAAADGAAVGARGDASVDTIVSCGGLEAALDPVLCLRDWRRVLKTGGTLALLLGTEGEDHRHRFPVAYVHTLLNLVGGFEAVSCTPADPRGDILLFVLQRSSIAEIRNPLATLGAALAESALAGPAARTELHFQLGTILLQAGEPGLARACFRRVLDAEPQGAEGHFGLGMAFGAEERWDEALLELEQAHRLDPSNAQVSRWLGLARSRTESATPLTLPAALPAATPAVPPVGQSTPPTRKWSPAPLPAGLRVQV